MVTTKPSGLLQEIESCLKVGAGARAVEVTAALQLLLQESPGKSEEVDQNFQHLQSAIERCAMLDISVERATNDVTLYGGGVQAMQSSGAMGSEYWAERISLESSTNHASSTMRYRDEAYQRATEFCRELYGLITGEPVEETVEQRAALIEDRINRLQGMLNATYGNEESGGRVLADLGDALAEAGRLDEALSRYEASVGHLKRSGQYSRASLVEQQIGQIKHQLAPEPVS